MKVTVFEDLRDPNGRLRPDQGATDAAGRNVLGSDLAKGFGGCCGQAARNQKQAYVEVCSEPCSKTTHQQPNGVKSVDTGTKTRRLADEFLR